MAGIEAKRAELKALDESGKGSALFSLWDTEDLDLDITRKGFYGDGLQEVFMVPHHLWTSGQPPLAKGVIFERPQGAVYEFEMNTELDQARSWLSHLRFDLSKGRAPRQVWSYGFRVLEGGSTPRAGHKGRELHALPSGQPGALVVEVSPVLAAAQPLSRTLGAKTHGDIGPGHPDYARIQRWHRKSELWAQIEALKVQIAAQAAHERWVHLQREIQQHV